MKKLFVIPALMAIVEPVCLKHTYAATTYTEDDELSITIPEGYPLKSAEYYEYSDCVSENPDDNIDCVMTRDGMTYAVAPFPTTEQKESSWWSLAEAWSQIGTIKKLSIDNDGRVREHNQKKPVPDATVCEYNFREYNDYSNCDD